MSSTKERHLARLRAWAQRPEVQALSEIERLERAVVELGLREMPCPSRFGCPGMGCRICGGPGVVFTLREVQ